MNGALPRFSPQPLPAAHFSSRKVNSLTDSKALIYNKFATAYCLAAVTSLRRIRGGEKRKLAKNSAAARQLGQQTHAENGAEPGAFAQGSLRWRIYYLEILAEGKGWNQTFSAHRTCCDMSIASWRIRNISILSVSSDWTMRNIMKCRPRCREADRPQFSAARHELPAGLSLMSRLTTAARWLRSADPSVKV